MTGPGETPSVATVREMLWRRRDVATLLPGQLSQEQGHQRHWRARAKRDTPWTGWEWTQLLTLNTHSPRLSNHMARHTEMRTMFTQNSGMSLHSSLTRNSPRLGAATEPLAGKAYQA